jgi:adenine-specific DNA-methyltransferase
MDKLDPRKDGASPDLTEENLDKLRELFPDAFTEGSDPNGPRWKVDFETLRQLLGDQVEDETERYRLTWHGKSRARQIAQTPSNGTLRPCPNESVNWDDTRNLFIEGDNLEVLKLLQKSYHKRVKMIYIDPPYNTGSEFIYPDRFQDNLDTYLRYTGQVDDQGFKISSNAESSGRYHTNWLNMMYPRLRLARNLLRDDGSIFISIDDNEAANLKKISDEIFGEENFIATIIWEKVHTRKNSSKYFSTSHDYILAYARQKDSWDRILLPRENTSAYKNPDNDPKGPWKPDPVTAHNEYSADYLIRKPNGVTLERPSGRYWAFSEENWLDKVKKGEVIWGEGDSYPMVKRYLSEVQDGLVPTTLFTRKFAGDTSQAKREIDGLLGISGIFDYPKPSKLIKRLAQITMRPDDLALDFFAGSCPIGQAIHDLNNEDGGQRSFIAVQLPEICEESTPAFNAGYRTISDIGKDRLRRVFENPKAGHKKSISGFKSFRLADSNIRPWAPDEDDLKTSLFDAVDNIKPDRRPADVLYELLLKFGLDLAAPVEEREIGGQPVHVVDRGALVACLADDIDLEVVNGIAALKEELAPEAMRVVFRDSGFHDDVVKTNAVQILRQAGIDDIKSL